MALGTKVRDCREGNHISIAGPMRHMAAQALHGHVLISRVNHLFPHGVVRMFRPIVAVLAKFGDGGLRQKKGVVRGMGGMTGITLSFFYGIMCEGTFYYLPFCGSFFLPIFFSKLSLQGHRILMALSTNGFHVSNQEFLL